MLGPLEASRDGEPIHIAGARQRSVLALLLIHADELVTVEALVEQLLGQQRSKRALNAVRVALSRLRRLLENGDEGRVLQARAGGYVLNLGPEQLDVATFEHLLREGRGLLGAGDAGSSAARLREAPALWQGASFAGLAHPPSAIAEHVPSNPARARPPWTRGRDGAPPRSGAGPEPASGPRRTVPSVPSGVHVNVISRRDRQPIRRQCL